jgi:hypothetical protein
MAEDINPTGPYNTKVPGYNEAADIQQALKVFLYGTTTLPANKSQVLSTSIAGYLKSIETDIETLNNKGIGSEVASTQPTGISNGHIWVDSTSSVTSSIQYATASYQTTAPSSPTTGALWVDSDTTPLKMYVWSGSAWREIGA